MFSLKVYRLNVEAAKIAKKACDDVTAATGKYFIENTLQPLYNTLRYNTVLDINTVQRWIPKMYRLYWKMTINGYFSV